MSPGHPQQINQNQGREVLLEVLGLKNKKPHHVLSSLGMVIFF